MHVRPAAPLATGSGKQSDVTAVFSVDDDDGENDKSSAVAEMAAQCCTSGSVYGENRV